MSKFGLQKKGGGFSLPDIIKGARNHVPPEIKHTALAEQCKCLRHVVSNAVDRFTHPRTPVRFYFEKALRSLFMNNDTLKFIVVLWQVSWEETAERSPWECLRERMS